MSFCADYERYEYEPTAIHAYKQGMAVEAVVLSGRYASLASGILG